MPFSFIEIEQKKSRVIGFLFVFIILFYFVTAYLILIVLENSFFSSFLPAGDHGLHLPSLDHSLIALGIALMVGLIHWMTSTNNIIEKISITIGAMPLDEKDTYHKYLKNIIDEVSVAIGGRPLEGRVIPSISMNAFALEDFNGRAVIGVTEGLLSRLNRSQIEAVVGHEAGHIVSGDCLSTTVTCALSEIYEETSSRMAAGIRNTRGRGSVVIILVFIVLSIMRFLSMLIRYFISRQREYRADAVSVRLTRDPLSLAEALKLISTNWRGEGSQGDKVESIFIVNPTVNNLDEAEGLYSDMFSTHPPISNRINILLDMAHLDEKALTERLKDLKRASPVAQAEVRAGDLNQPREWFVFVDQAWKGPYLIGELKSLSALAPDTWIRTEEGSAVRHAYEDKDLLGLFNQDKKEGLEFHCPHCKTLLSEINYEGAPIFKCAYCEGVFVENDKVSRILIRRDMDFSEEVIRLAGPILKGRQNFTTGRKKIQLKNTWLLDCPKCSRKMRSQFFVYSYPVEIDRCIFCDGIWFDKTELEILQFIYQHKEEYFDGTSF